MQELEEGSSASSSNHIKIERVELGTENSVTECKDRKSGLEIVEPVLSKRALKKKRKQELYEQIKKQKR